MPRRNNKRQRRNSNKVFVIKRPEVKHHDVAGSTIAVTSAGVFGTVVTNAVLRDTTSSTRIGDTVTIKKFGIRFQVTNTDPIDDGDCVRLIVLVDHQPNGADPAVLDVLQTADEQSFRATKTMKRFTFLMDKYFDWNSSTVNIVDPPSAFAVTRTCFSFFKDLNLEVEYLQSANSISSISTNAIHVFAISAQASDTTILWSSRVSYTDF